LGLPLFRFSLPWRVWFCPPFFFCISPFIYILVTVSPLPLKKK
jgi:hypothetical protein